MQNQAQEKHTPAMQKDKKRTNGADEEKDADLASYQALTPSYPSSCVRPRCRFVKYVTSYITQAERTCNPFFASGRKLEAFFI
jgi:hypothetical protein